MARKFKWDMWDFDGNGLAYIIAKDMCPNRCDVPKYIVKNDYLDPSVMDSSYGEHLCEDGVMEGWCKFQVRSDWMDMEGEAHGWYVVNLASHGDTAYQHRCGWFPVWVVRVGEWY